MPVTLQETISNMMKRIYITAVMLGMVFWIHAQEGFSWIQGTVTFVSSRNVYVRFATTEQISIGDTLFILQGESYEAALVMENKSSTSAVCMPVIRQSFVVGSSLYARVKSVQPKPEAGKPTPSDTAPQAVVPAAPILTPEEDSVSQVLALKERISTRLSVASYSNFSEFRNLHRMRYGLNFTGQHLGGSKLSIESYIIYRQTLGVTDNSQNTLAEALKVYGLSLRYDLNNSTALVAGRRINPRMSSIGAMDGLQVEKTLGRVSLGGVLGSRPNFNNYAFDFNLLQTGAFVGWNSKPGGRFHQTTLGFLEQMNHFHTDRRFVYLQHSSQPLKNLNIFGSMEADLFEQIQEIRSTNLKITNIFVSARLRVSKKLQLNGSFDSRRNIIYYESYKNYLDQLIEDETRQGLRVGFSYNPWRFVTMGANSSWRFQKSGANSTSNYNGYINLAKLGSLKIRTSLTANILETGYLRSQIYGARFSHQIVRNKLDAEAYYRRIQYQFITSSNATDQNVFGASLSITAMKSLNLFLFYEGILAEPEQTLHRLNTRLQYRF